MAKSKKLLSIVLISVLLVLAIAVTAVVLLTKGEEELENFRNEALEILEERLGEYDENNIVLSDTSRSEAKTLAEKLNADLRISANGKFAVLKLKDGVTIRDVYADDANLKYLKVFSADYYAEINDTELVPAPTYPSYSYGEEIGGYLDYLNLKDLWITTKGSGITVAVIDTGVDTDHPELSGRISEYSYNATLDKRVLDYTLADGSYDWSLVEDEQGHGTSVVGALAAGLNDMGMAGAAPEVTVIVIKAECDSSGRYTRTSDLVFGLYYAIECDVNVVNMSFGTYGFNPFASAAKLAVDSDIICIASAGNDKTAALSYPAADENVIGVGALSEDSWELASYSNYGDNVNICAPGTVYTTAMGGGYKTSTGTSLAAPLVSGVMALLSARDKYITFDKVSELIAASSLDLGVLGEDFTYGFGAIDAYALILEERGVVTYNMMTDELEDVTGMFVRNHAHQSLLEPTRYFSVFDGWYYDPHYTKEYVYYEDKLISDLTLYAKWTGEEDGVPFGYRELSDGTMEITSYKGRRRYISVPEYIEGKLVTSIGDYAFSGEHNLREVSLPDGINNIGAGAFYNCSNLVKIEIPKAVTKIGNEAFYNNVRLSEIGFAADSSLKVIGEFAFAYCSSLTRFELPASVESVFGSSFAGTVSLGSVSVAVGNKNYRSEGGVLYNNTLSTLVVYPAGLSGDFTIPESVLSINSYAFAFTRADKIELSNVRSIGGCAFVSASLSSVTIPDSVHTLGEGAFMHASRLSAVTLGSGISEISGNAFYGAVSLKEIFIPENIKFIGEYAFWGSALSEVTFAEKSKLEKIGGYAFAATPIIEISLPEPLTEIGEYAFSDCVLLSAVDFGENASLVTIGTYAFASTVSLSEIILPKALRNIGDFAFLASGISGTVNIPTLVSYFGAGAFASCSSLTEFTVDAENESYNAVGGVVFTEDGKILTAYPAGNESTSYTLPNTTEKVGDAAFYGAANLTSLRLNTGLLEISPYAFAYSSVGSVQIPDSLIQLARFAFIGAKVTSITFGTDSLLPRIGYGALAYTDITSITIPKNVSAIAQGAFLGCEKLTSVTFASNSKLESISAYTFDGAKKLRTVTFNSGSALNSIQAHGFEGMANLTTVNFGDAKLTNIDNFAFRFCDSLTTVTLPDTLTNIGRYAFYECERLKTLNLPISLEHIGSYAFLGAESLELYFKSEILPIYLDEDWDRGIKSYYLGVTSVTTSGDWKYAALASGGVAILGYTGSDTFIDMTALDFSGDIVTIGSSVFAYSPVESVVLPETLVTVQAEAFYHSALKSVEIPASVKFIGYAAFADTPVGEVVFAENCQIETIEQSAFERTKSLSSIIIPASVTSLGRAVLKDSAVTSVTLENGSTLTEIPAEAFSGTNIITFTAPESIVKIGDSAFMGTASLESFTFTNTLDELWLSANAFYKSGLREFNIPENLTVIEEFALADLERLTEFTVAEGNEYFTAKEGLLLTKDTKKIISAPAGMTGSLTLPISIEEIGYGAFEGSKLSAVIFLPDANILSIGYRAFFGAENITEIIVPDSVVAIDYYAFAYAKNLKRVEFGDASALRGVYEGAFYGCTSLSDVTLPVGVVEISDYAFYGCSSLESLPIDSNAEIKGIYSYAFAYTGLSGEFTLPSTLLDIGSYAFLGTKVEKVTVPADNERDLVIGLGAFAETNSITEITLPLIGASYEDEDITWFGYIFGAGGYKANTTYIPATLKKVNINGTITSVGSYAFYGVESIEEIDLPDTVDTVYTGAFYKTVARYEIKHTLELISAEGALVTSVSSLYIGKGISGKVKLSEKITSIGNAAFSGCKFLESVEIPCNVTIIDGFAFDECDSLKSIEIPSAVTMIGDRAFDECASLESVHFVEGSKLTSIKTGAFGYCKLLKSINIPQKVTNIGNDAFTFCSSLDNVIIPSGITSIGSSTFYYCTSLESISIPSGVTSIGSNAFYGCKNLKSVDFGENSKLASIYGSAFMLCDALASIKIPLNVTSIGSKAFYGTALTSVEIPENIESIESNAFYYCRSLHRVVNNSDLTLSIGATDNGYVAYYAKILVDKDGNKTYIEKSDGTVYIETTDGFLFSRYNVVYKLIAYVGSAETVTLPTDINGNSYTIYQMRGVKNVIIPQGITSIDNQAFYGCTSLQNVEFSSSVINIGSQAFYGCYSLKNVNGLSSVTSIGYDAFQGCISLESIVIPASVTSIGSGAFANCGAKITVSSGNSNFIESEGVIYNNGVTKIICVSANVTEFVIPKTVTDISSAFSGNTSIKKVSFEKGTEITNVGNSAFEGCSSLENIIIPDGVTSIGSHAFGSCTSLVRIVIPDSVTVIRDWAFFECRALQEVAFGENSQLISIGDSVFSICTSLERITLPKGVTNLGKAFSSCSSLKFVDIPDGVTRIVAQTFFGCDSLEKISIPSGLISIEREAFYNCTSLEKIYIPSSVSSIDNSAFYGCATLNITLDPANESYIMSGGVIYDNPVTSIIFVNSASSGKIEIISGITEIRGFEQKTGIVEVALPKSATSIRAGAFSGCSSLKRIVIPEGVTSIGANAFEDCISLENVVIPDSVQSIESWTFYGCVSLTSIKIPLSVTSIGDYAFRESSLEKIEIPSSVTNIGSYAFYYCPRLLCVVFDQNCKIDSIGTRAFEHCNKLYKVINNSDLELTIGSTDNGYVAYYAKVIVDKDVNKTYRTDSNGTTYIETSNGFMFSLYNGTYKLIAYMGSEETVTLPTDINGNSYTIYQMRGVKNVIIPEGVTSIGSDAFSGCSSLESIEIPSGVTSIDSLAFNGCSSLTSIEIPSGVTSIGSSAFYGTAFYNNPDNWEDGALYIDGHLISVLEGVKRFEVKEDVKAIAGDAFNSCKYTLKHLTIGGNHSYLLSGFTNLETLVIREMPTSHYIYGYFGSSASSVPSTLEKIVLKSGVDMRSNAFIYITGVKIYVEDNERDVRWDANYPGWNNGNSVSYGDKWIYADFLDECGNILSSEIFGTSEVIRIPYYYLEGNEEYSYIVRGWDTDGDGEIDTVPATSSSDIRASAVVEKVTNKYTVTFIDKDGVTPIYKESLEYGTVITAPEAPTKAGYTFVSYKGFSEGMTVTGNVTFESVWRHVGDGHEYGEPVWVDAGCTSQGGYKHICTLCGEWYLTDSVDAIGHSYTAVTVLPTCILRGYDEYTCSCGDSYRDNYTDAIGHTYGEWEITAEAGCVSYGERKRECTVIGCGSTETEKIAPTGHSYEVESETEATCSNEGVIIYACECGDKITERTEKLAHSYVKVKVGKNFWQWLFELALKIFIGYEGSDPYYYACENCNKILTDEEARLSYTASVNSACEHIAGEWGTLLPPTYFEGGVEGVLCEKCEKVLEAYVTPMKQADPSFKITGASLNLTEDINIIYAVNLPDGYESPYIVFEFRGETYTVTEYDSVSGSTYRFKFTGILPQYMADNICATVYASVDGEAVSYTLSEYSALKYCQALLSIPAYASNEKLVTLISDLLTYGAATQIYRGYKTDALVTDIIAEAGITLTPSTYNNTSISKSKLTGDAADGLSFSGAGLYLTNAMAVYFTFKAEDTTDLALRVKIGSRTTEYDVSTLTPDAQGKYTVHVYNVMAHEFDKEITVNFVRDGEVVGQTLTYSVNTYTVVALDYISDEKTKNLIKAIYNYGASVVNYRG